MEIQTLHEQKPFCTNTLPLCYFYGGRSCTPALASSQPAWNDFLLCSHSNDMQHWDGGQEVKSSDGRNGRSSISQQLRRYYRREDTLDAACRRGSAAGRHPHLQPGGASGVDLIGGFHIVAGSGGAKLISMPWLWLRPDTVLICGCNMCPVAASRTVLRVIVLQRSAVTFICTCLSSPAVSTQASLICLHSVFFFFLHQWS